MYQSTPMKTTKIEISGVFNADEDAKKLGHSQACDNIKWLYIPQHNV